MDSDDEYIVQQFSEDGGTDSSDEDEMVMKEFFRQSGSGAKRSLKDFESEMENEADIRVAAYLEKEQFSDPLKPKSDISEERKSRDYFDTDSEEGEEPEDPTVEAKSNMDLFYDPLMDSKDEKYVQRQRDMYRTKLVNQTKPKPLPNSDAVLNCPACFTTLCHDCQRHETIKTQYRAMFTFHCQVDLGEVMKVPLQSQKNRSKKALSQPGEAQFSGEEDTYHPVRCSVCNTHVAMLDRDEVYHFFNVVTSH
ncbi:hypothetical protein GHT06_018614 [Daphnia sinensis]|uniref:E2F-associated phosphoprotein n=1 Tax=Daphnia sinensis TaxID=1820382 RepID=A0AAD5KMR6_9CRUS|nr:hypothetical protein GHT06_018614 [Daphnia sinensis]